MSGKNLSDFFSFKDPEDGCELAGTVGTLSEKTQIYLTMLICLKPRIKDGQARVKAKRVLRIWIINTSDYVTELAFPPYSNRKTLKDLKSENKMRPIIWPHFALMHSFIIHSTEINSIFYLTAQLSAKRFSEKQT